jgi:hypothetical protein
MPGGGQICVQESGMWEAPQCAESGGPLKPAFLTPGRREAGEGTA